MNNFFLRTESIKPEELLNLSVTNPTDRVIISALKSPEPCLLEGARGTGKSFLMKVAEQEIEQENHQCLTVFISFSQSSLINSADPLQFYHWMLAKMLKSLMNKLRKKGLLVSHFSANLLSNDFSNTEDEVISNLKQLVGFFENSYKTENLNIDTEKLPDIEDVKEAIHNICEENNLTNIYFFFDEAAHVFRPEQQRQFFTLF